MGVAFWDADAVGEVPASLRPPTSIFAKRRTAVDARVEDTVRYSFVMAAGHIPKWGLENKTRQPFSCTIYPKGSYGPGTQCDARQRSGVSMLEAGNVHRIWNFGFPGSPRQDTMGVEQP